jgi:hypothetical protein
VAVVERVRVDEPIDLVRGNARLHVRTDKVHQLGIKAAGRAQSIPLCFVVNWNGWQRSLSTHDARFPMMNAVRKRTVASEADASGSNAEFSFALLPSKP